MGDLYNNLLTKITVPNALRSVTVTGTGVDRNVAGTVNPSGLGFQSALVVVFTGTMTDGTATIEVQDSDDNITFTAVAAAYLQGTSPVIASTDDDKVFGIGYLGGKRYIRVVGTAAGTTTGGVYGALVVLGDPRRATTR